MIPVTAASGIPFKYIVIAGAAVVIVLFSVLIGILIGLKINKRYESEFKLALADLEPEYMRFYNKLYAVFVYKDFQVYCSYCAVEKSIPIILPGESSVSIIIRVKIPGTTGMKFHLSAFPGEKSRLIYKLTGWGNPEPGFFTGKIKIQSETEVMEMFHKLSQSSKEAIKNITTLCGRSTISPDWETVIIGEKNSLKLAGGNREVLGQLDFQITTPVNSSTGEFKQLLDKIIIVVRLISEDLG